MPQRLVANRKKGDTPNNQTGLLRVIIFCSKRYRNAVRWVNSVKIENGTGKHT